MLGPPDGVAIEQAALTLVADVAALALVAGTKVAALRPVPVELAITAVDTMPRLRRVVEAALGQPAADTAIAVGNAAAQGLAQGVLGLGLDAAYRVLALRAATANAAAWQARLRPDLRTSAREPAVPAVVLQQQREPERRRTTLTSQQRSILIQQRPELDQLININPDRLHATQSFPHRHIPRRLPLGLVTAPLPTPPHAADRKAVPAPRDSAVRSLLTRHT